MENKQFQKQVAKEGFQTANAKYMGLAEEPKTGTTEKGAWRKAKVNFHIEGKSQPNKFIIWSPMNSDKTQYKSDEEIKQFETYRIIWVEENKEHNNKEWVEKKIVIIKDKTDEQQTELTQQEKQEDNEAVMKDKLATWVHKFIEAYNNALPKESQSLDNFQETLKIAVKDIE